jgi:hypothetical protein
VLQYYYQGVPSWNWYYPFHYAPFASDLVNIESHAIDFEKSEPFKPVEQLLAVLPAESVAALPKACQPLMVDPSSPIYDLYDSDAPIDPNGKHLPWLWVLLLPFVDERRVRSAFLGHKRGLTLEERRRNAFGCSVLFVHRTHALMQASHGHLRNRPGAETDPDVLEALNDGGGGGEAADGDGDVEVNPLGTVAGSSGAAEEEGAEAGTGAEAGADGAWMFDAVAGGGICGTLSPAPGQWFVRLTEPGRPAVVPAPPTPFWSFEVKWACFVRDCACVARFFSSAHLLLPFGPLSRRSFAPSPLSPYPRAVVLSPIPLSHSALSLSPSPPSLHPRAGRTCRRTT